MSGASRPAAAPAPRVLVSPERTSPRFQAVLRQRCEQARLGLVADLDAQDHRYATAAAAATGPGIRLLCAAKASTHPEVLRRASAYGLGFDVANQRELAHARAARAPAPAPAPAPAMSLTTPALPLAERSELYAAFRRGEITRWHCDSLGQLAELARACPGSPVGMRVNLDGLDIPPGMPLWRPSRFGIPLDQLPAARDIAAAHGCAVRWLHVHNGSEENDTASYVFAARQIVAAAQVHGIGLEALDLGGGLLVEPTSADLGAFFRAIRAAAGPAVELSMEPGRFWLTDCMSLVTQVLDIKQTAHHVLLVLDFGLMSHLQWSDHLRIPALGTVMPGDPRPWRICGRSCFEEDWLEEWEKVPVVEGGPVPAVGDCFVLGNVSGYSVELSCDFNGIRRPALEICRP